MYSQYVVEEYGWCHEYDARDAEVCDIVCMWLPEELSTAVSVKYAPEQRSQWSHQSL